MEKEVKNFDGNAIMEKMAEKVAQKKKKKSFKRNSVPWTKNDLLLLHLHVARVTTDLLKEFKSITRYLGVCSPLRKKFSAKTISCKWSNLRDRENCKISQKLHTYLLSVKAKQPIINPWEEKLEEFKSIKTPILLKEEIVKKEISPISPISSDLSLTQVQTQVQTDVSYYSKPIFWRFLSEFIDNISELEMENISDNEIGKIKIIFHKNK
jgi:hypothetical protein